MAHPARAHRAFCRGELSLRPLSGTAAARATVVTAGPGLRVHVRLCHCPGPCPGHAACRPPAPRPLGRGPGGLSLRSHRKGGRAGWTVEHSHSGFNAFRHHLLAYRTRERPRLYGQMQDHLLTARAILDGVREGRIDIGPLDAYWHLLVARHAPQLTEGIRVLASTELAPIPAFVTSADAPEELVARLRAAFVGAASQPWFAPLGDLLLLDGFTAVSAVQYAPLLAWDREAKAAGYGLPA